MHVIQLARSQWLVVDNHYHARFLIVEGPLVLRETRRDDGEAPRGMVGA